MIEMVRSYLNGRDDVILAKAATVRRCLDRTSQVTEGNIAIHDYQKMDLDILKSVVSHHLDDLVQFCSFCLNL